MLMGEKMILTIFIIAFTLRAESEFQIFIIFVCTSADGTFMSGNTGTLFYFLLKLLSAFHLLRCHVDLVSALKIEDRKIDQ